MPTDVLWNQELLAGYSLAYLADSSNVKRRNHLRFTIGYSYDGVARQPMKPSESNDPKENT